MWDWVKVSCPCSGYGRTTVELSGTEELDINTLFCSRWHRSVKCATCANTYRNTPQNLIQHLWGCKMAQSCNSLVYSAAQLVVSATDQKVGGLVPGSPTYWLPIAAASLMCSCPTTLSPTGSIKWFKSWTRLSQSSRSADISFLWTLCSPDQWPCLIST